MKRKTLSLLLASMLCLLILCPSFLSADADVRMEPVETAETILDLSTEDPEAFGGLYYDEEMQLVYCYVGGLEDVPAQLQGRSSGVRLQQVERSMAELEAMKDALVPYMNDYGIFSLDADEMTNKVRIEVYERSPALEQLLENDVDSYEIVEVGDIQVDDLLLSAEEHQAMLAQGETPYNWESESSQAETVSMMAATPIYPGFIMTVGTGSDTYYCTAGPRISSSSFYTCGHVLNSFFNYAQSVYYSGAYVGTTGSRVFGSAGDRCTITLKAPTSQTLPSSNLNLEGKTYTYGTPIAGEKVAMHGGYSGITEGTVSSVNVTISVDGTTIGRACRASYTCKSGDSGAAVFSRSTSVRAVGIQCAGTNQGDGGKYYTSFFTMLP